MGDRSVFDRGTATPTSTTPLPSVPSFKVILIGEVGVGKTSLFMRVRDTKLKKRDQPVSTIGVDTCTRTFTTKKGSVTLTLWDTAGVERFRTLTRNYYRNTHAALLVFALDDPASLFYLPRWEKDVAESAPEAVKFLVGNKGDQERVVTKVSMQNFAAAHNCQTAFLTSAKTGEGVEEALTTICERLVAKYQDQSKLENSEKVWRLGSGPNLHNSDEHKTKPCCG